MNQSIPISQSPRIRKHVTVTENEHRRLRIMAADTGQSLSAIVSGLINAEYSRYKQEKSRHEKINQARSNEGPRRV
jgi:hypothetical protein